jgi:hypothetical protein
MECDKNDKKYLANPNDYECNTKTGRWKKKRTKHHFDDERYVYHPDTGKRYVKTGKIGREIIEMMNKPVFENPDKVPEDIKNLSEKSSMKEIREIIKKYNLNIKDKVKTTLIEKIKNIYKRRENKDLSIDLEKPKMNTVEKNSDSSKDSSSDDNFFSEKEEKTSQMTDYDDDFFGETKKSEISPAMRQMFLPDSSSTVKSSSKKSTDKKEKKSLSSAFVPSNDENFSLSETVSSQPSLKEQQSLNERLNNLTHSYFNNQNFYVQRTIKDAKENVEKSHQEQSDANDSIIHIISEQDGIYQYKVKNSSKVKKGTFDEIREKYNGYYLQERNRSTPSRVKLLSKKEEKKKKKELRQIIQDIYITCLILNKKYSENDIKKLLKIDLKETILDFLNYLYASSSNVSSSLKFLEKTKLMLQSKLLEIKKEDLLSADSSGSELSSLHKSKKNERDELSFSSRSSDKKDTESSDKKERDELSFSSRSSDKKDTESSDKKKDNQNPCQCNLMEFQPNEWDIIEVPGDHHCGFHCVVYGLRSSLKKTNIINVNDSDKNLVLKLRCMLIEHYKNQNDEKYIDIVNDPEYWMEDVDLQVFSDIFDICFCVYDKASDKMRHIIYDKHLNKQRVATDEEKKLLIVEHNVFTKITPFSKDSCKFCIYLYQNGIHYNVMFPKNFKYNKNAAIPQSIEISNDDIVEYLTKNGFDFLINQDTNSFLTLQDSSLSSQKTSVSSQKTSVSSQKTSVSSELEKESSFTETEQEMIVKDAHRNVIEDIKKLQVRNYTKFNQLTNVEVTKIIKESLHSQHLPFWLK